MARRIAVTGLLPRVGYRAKVMPLAPTPMQKLRRGLGQLLEARALERRLSTSLLLDPGRREPGIALPAAAIRLRLKASELGRAAPARCKGLGAHSGTAAVA